MCEMFARIKVWVDLGRIEGIVRENRGIGYVDYRIIRINQGN